MREFNLYREHLLIKHFPYLKYDDITPLETKKKVSEYLKKDYPNITIVCEKKDHMNWRAPVSIPYYVKDFIKGKTLFHIGCGSQTLDVEFVKYAEKLISCEISDVSQNDQVKGNWKFYPKTNYIDVIKNYPDIDIFYFWCGFKTDILILDYLSKIYSKSKFLITLPQEKGKLTSFCVDLKNWLESNKKFKMDYITVPFDESDQKIVRETQFTKDNQEKEWNEWKSFDTMKGLWILILIEPV